jgi:hypothetical protein
VQAERPVAFGPDRPSNYRNLNKGSIWKDGDELLWIAFWWATGPNNTVRSPGDNWSDNRTVAISRRAHFHLQREVLGRTNCLLSSETIRTAEKTTCHRVLIFLRISNIRVIQRYQNKVLKCIVNAPWYVGNSDHRDRGIEAVTDVIAKFANSHEKRLQNHINIEASRLLNVKNITRRLKRKKPFELVRR